jgi:beta-lactam-binding protein with PASTA domain
MSLKQFLTSKIFLKQLVYSVVLTLVLVILTLALLRIYTRHGSDFPVPDVSGMVQDEFESILAKAHLRYRVIDTSYIEGVKPGGVIDQVPDAGHHVKRGRTILLTINATSPGMVAMPQVTDISYRQASVQLEQAGLVPGNISYEPSEFQNLVLKAKLNGREIRAGEMVTKGSIIDLVLGTGAGGATIVPPDLKGLTSGEARFRLESLSLRLGSVICDETILTPADSLSSFVYRQHPDPRFATMLYPGSAVDIWLTTDPSKFPKKEPEEEQLDF